MAVPEHIQTNRTAQAARSARYPVTLSTYSFQLLLAFLQGAKLWLLLSIINEHVKVQVCSCKDSALMQSTRLVVISQHMTMHGNL